MMGRGLPERPVPQIRVAIPPSTTTTVSGPLTANPAPTEHTNNTHTHTGREGGREGGRRGREGGRGREEREGGEGGRKGEGG